MHTRTYMLVQYIHVHAYNMHSVVLHDFHGANCDSDVYGSIPLCGHVMTSISPRVLE